LVADTNKKTSGETTMTPEDSPVDELLKFYSVDSMSDLEDILLEEETEDVDDLELVALDVLRTSGF
jgi:hypothetical protein